MYRLLVVGSRESPCTKELAEEGFEVEVVSTPAEAPRKVAHLRPDMVVIDVCLPSEVELDLLESVRAQNNAVPIVVRGDEAEHWNEFRSWSADMYVDPTEDLNALKGAVRALLERRSESQKADGRT